MTESRVSELSTLRKLQSVFFSREFKNWERRQLKEQEKLDEERIAYEKTVSAQDFFFPPSNPWWDHDLKYSSTYKPNQKRVKPQPERLTRLLSEDRVKDYASFL